MSNYTPTTEVVRGDYTAHSATYAGKPSSESGAEFDRWLDDVIRKAKAEAWAEAVAHIGYNDGTPIEVNTDFNPYTEEP